MTLRSNLRTQLLLLLLVLPVLLLAVEYRQAKERHEQAVQEVLGRVQALAADLSREHAHVMDEARDLLVVLAAVPELHDTSRCRALLAPLVAQFPRYANMGVAEPDGRIRCNARGTAEQVSLADRAYIQEARRTGTFAVSDYEVGPLTGLPIVSIAYPEAGGAGIVFVSIDVAWLGNALDVPGFPPGTRFLLTDAGGHVLAAYPPTPGWLGEMATSIPSFAALESGTGNVVQLRDREGVDRLLARAPLDRSGVDRAPVVAVGVPADAALAPVRRALVRDAAVLASFLLFGVVTVWAADARLFRPLGAVGRAARRIGAGDPTARSGVPPQGGAVGELAGSFDDMAVAVEEKERLERHVATHDALTGLPNRRALTEHLADAIAEARAHGLGVAVALVIVERLHDIVNTLGHPTGDTLLTQIGARLTDAFGPDAVLARVGGGEFAALLPCSGADDPTLLRSARRIHEAMTRPFQAGDIQIEPGGSIGIATFPEHGDDPDGLVQHAGVAAVAARQARVDVAIYSPCVDPWTSRRLRLIGGLRSALRDGEMAMVLHPKLDLRTGRPAGAEALVRWRHPELGVVSPVEFIGLAEQTGAIRPLTRWMVEQAAACSRRLADAGTPVRISVNFSARDLTDPGFGPQIAAILADTGASPESLELEVTESLLIADPSEARATLRALSAMGLTLSIDDFGTGYCSLAYLRDLPVDLIKIDKAFILDGPGRLHDAALTRCIIDLGHTLGLEVLAEGVSSAPIEQALRQLGCDLAQGDLYGRPMDEAAFVGWLAQVRPPVWEPA